LNVGRESPRLVQTRTNHAPRLPGRAPRELLVPGVPRRVACSKSHARSRMVFARPRHGAPGYCLWGQRRGYTLLRNRPRGQPPPIGLPRLHRAGAARTIVGRGRPPDGVGQSAPVCGGDPRPGWGSDSATPEGSRQRRSPGLIGFVASVRPFLEALVPNREHPRVLGWAVASPR